jgi:hypothetical protein
MKFCLVLQNIGDVCYRNAATAFQLSGVLRATILFMEDTIATLESMIRIAHSKGFVVQQVCGPIGLLSTLFGYPFRQTVETYVVAVQPELLLKVQ